jgi:2-hydroxy-6-oxonona-2,4-dienedioate hydrolase
VRSTGDRTAIVAALDARAERVSMAAPGGRMTWRRWGAGPPLVLLHGASGSWTHWLRNIPALAERCTVLVPDMPGFGDSDDLPEPHTAEALADAVTAGLDALVPAPAVLALSGFSFGSIVAGLVAARLGRRLSAVILIGAGGLGLVSEAAAVRLQRFTAGMSEAEAREVHRANLRTLMLGDPAAADDLAVDLQIDNVRRTRFRSGDIPTSDVLLRALPAIRAPLTTMWGERDAFVAPRLEARRRTVAAIHPDVDFRVLPGAGHWAIYESAEPVNRALLEILSRGRPADPASNA